jgi:uncharacterized paraquat-inducible protein A
MWNKLTFVCADCDTLVEATSLKKDLEHAWCPACGMPLNLISVEDATREEN